MKLLLIFFVGAMGFSAVNPTANYQHGRSKDPKHPIKGEIVPFSIADNEGPVLYVDNDGNIFVEGKYVTTSKRAAANFTDFGNRMKVLKDSFENFYGGMTLSPNQRQQ